MNESIENMNEISWEALRAQTDVFVEKLESSLEQLGMLEKCRQLAIDHACVRLKDPAAVAAFKESLTTNGVGEVVSAVNVNGREIMIIQLAQPLALGPWQTPGIELPYPKPNHSYEDGWEHVEFVLPGAENTMDGVCDAFSSAFPHLSKEQLVADYAYSEDEPHAEGDQMPNPTVSIKVNGVGLKFHANSIQKVVGYAE